MIRNYGFVNDVSVPGQNRMRETYMGCGGPACDQAGMPLRGLDAVASGQYMGAIGKVVGMRGLGAMYLAPVSRAQAELDQLGVGPARSVIRVRGLGDGTRDRAMCQASFTAGQAGVDFASQQHQTSGGGDQGWTTALGIASAITTVGGAFCNFIDTGAPQPATPIPQQYGSMPAQPMYQQPPAQEPPWLMIGGAALAALVVGALVFGK